LKNAIPIPRLIDLYLPEVKKGDIIADVIHVPTIRLVPTKDK